MYKKKHFTNTWFSADVLRSAYKQFLNCADLKEKDVECSLYVNIHDVTWGHNSIEEFFADYRQATGLCRFKIYSRGMKANLEVIAFGTRQTSVRAQFSDRQDIEAVFEVFEKHAETSRIPRPPKPPPARPEIFIGHGRSPLWRDLKDHLHELHGYEVVAYEIGARAGHTIRDILESMLGKGTFAILVMTGEDETKSDLLIPRLNVVHELGLFQGRMGFSKAIVLLEGGTQEFSNIHGTHQIRFAKGNIRETFGDVLATLRREFPG